MRARTLLVVLAIAFASACFGPKHPRGSTQGTNVGAGSDNDGPWNGGGGIPAFTGSTPK